ncbi:capsule assembly Wzi family protein [Mucilaginibacter sp.]|uniref:capsule assembly Wzi family protein n=1 Tax=Mucilaginibacter sp. TaxID=1882438 RepID=UPI0026183499|nr:capsule assembly Wzi family protein [Mucilaginibacter sp.]MDB4926287.1 hypothetical protein [Mucilaginibacter sp.]
MKIIKLTIIGVLLVFIQAQIHAQSLPVGTTAVEDYYRRAQLLGATDTTVSFMVRPLFPNYIDKKADAFYPDSTEKRYNVMNATSSWQSKDGKLKASLLPLTIQTQFNSDHPYGWNDGLMIPAKGSQTLISLGIFAKYGLLTVQFRPELVIAENSNFENFNKNHYDVIFARYYDIYNNIDLPVQFGTGSYNRISWGQSSIRLNFKSLSFGLSTENLWWGPGIRNSLLMSNSAPGFPHLTLNTLHPVQTPIGSFEGQLIAGALNNSGFPPLEPDHYYFGTDLYVRKQNEWRYLAGIIITWQPKWVPGLFLGFDQSSQTYGKNLSSIRDYLPLFSPVKQTNAPDNPISKSDQLSSVFMRWLWPQEHAEIYFEYGQYNNTQDFLQQLLTPNNSRAYIFGIRKILPFNHSHDENIMISVEATQLQETSVNDILNRKEWYVSQNIRQGYTNMGEVLGAGIGPGANLQSVDVSWIKGLKKIGLQIERYVHNNDFYYYAFADSKDYTRHWVDMSLAFNGEWNYKNFVFNAKLQGIQSLDYQWALKQPGDDITFANQVSKFNLQIQTGVNYRF